MQQGIFWLFSALKVVQEPDALPYLVKIPMEYGAIGYLDIRVAILQLAILVTLLIVVPLVTSGRSPEVRQFGFVALLVGVLFGLLISAFNILVWPWSVGAAPLRLIPLALTVGLAVLGKILRSLSRSRV
ncbi:Uncharacterised protein [Mycobacteroides abscessus subsp. abscessus]|nr:Uncharacterised protein [Mycobacteroides abscessus subsp. abscessus]